MKKQSNIESCVFQVGDTVKSRLLPGLTGIVDAVGSEDHALIKVGSRYRVANSRWWNKVDGFGL